MTTSRAVENQTYMVALTQTGLLPDGKENLGHSMIIDYEGKIMDQIEEIEGGVYAEVNFPQWYELRDKCTILKDIKDSYEVIIK
jgi:predicted amidohydrolase